MDSEPTTPTEPAATREDHALVERLRRRDEQAFRELVDRHGRPLRRLARAFVSSDASAAEVVQETWLAVLGGLATFEGRSSLKTWIFHILVNRAKSRGVREGRQVPMSALASDEDAGEPAVDPDRFDDKGMWSQPPVGWGDPEALAAAKETRAAIDRALTELPERQRTVITLRDIEGWSSDEVCNVLGISVTNQRVLLHRARSVLRRALERHFEET